MNNLDENILNIISDFETKILGWKLEDNEKRAVQIMLYKMYFRGQQDQMNTLPLTYTGQCVS